LILTNGKVWTGDGFADSGAAGGIDLRGRQQIALSVRLVLECSGARSRAPAAEAAAATRAGTISSPSRPKEFPM